MFFSRQHLHFAGIGGIGMSGIAEVLLNLGYTISGSDLKLSPITDRLVIWARGLRGHTTPKTQRREGAGSQFRSQRSESRSPGSTPSRIPVIPRGELLAELMRLKYGIAIAGSHGKTTTTSMVAAILNHAGMDPTVVVGGKAAAMGGSNARVGKSEFLVVESDESDGSFLKLSPILAVVTNIDREHLDHYADIQTIRDAFADFVNKVPFYGAAIVCLDDKRAGHPPRHSPPKNNVREKLSGRLSTRRNRMRGHAQHLSPAKPALQTSACFASTAPARTTSSTQRLRLR